MEGDGQPIFETVLVFTPMLRSQLGDEITCPGCMEPSMSTVMHESNTPTPVWL